MTTENSTSSAARNIALLRLIVLKFSELKGIGTGSRGLTKGGQTDLAFVLPRTAAVAAVEHAASVVSQGYDENVRARGVYHLFRLPMTWEAQIHQASLEQINTATISDAETDEQLLGLFSDLPSAPAPGSTPEGALDLGKIDLSRIPDLAKLVAIYRSALSAGRQVVPFFRLHHS